MLKTYQFSITLCGLKGRNPFWLTLCSLFLFSMQPTVWAAEHGTTEFVPDQQGYQKLVAPFFSNRIAANVTQGTNPKANSALMQHN